MDLVDELETSGQAVVIRPEAPVTVGRMEKDISKLEALYEQGFRNGEKFISKYIDWGINKSAFPGMEALLKIIKDRLVTISFKRNNYIKDIILCAVFSGTYSQMESIIILFLES